MKSLQLFKIICLFTILYKWFLISFKSDILIFKFELEISAEIKLLNDLKYKSLKEIYIFKLDVAIKSSFFLFASKLIEAFSTNKCGLGNGLYETFPDVFKYILKFL